MNKSIFWEHKDQPGCEFLTINRTDSCILSEGLVIFSCIEGPFKFSYKVITDQRWLTKSVEIINLENQETLHLHSDSQGAWYKNNSRLSGMDQVIDVDISITPFSNTLPINRLNWELGQERDLFMLFIDVLSLTIMTVEQKYKFIRSKDQGYREFLYKSKDYETILTVDKDGIVIDYPKAFKRRY